MNLTYLQQSGSESVCVLDTANTPMIPMGASLAFVPSRFHYRGIIHTALNTTAMSTVTVYLDGLQVHPLICFVG